ncbi:hypothetical protein Tco_1007086 [Tanacetum coccineum]
MLSLLSQFFRQPPPAGFRPLPPENFSGEFFDQVPKASPSPDLPDPHHHAPISTTTNHHSPPFDCYPTTAHTTTVIIIIVTSSSSSSEHHHHHPLVTDAATSTPSSPPQPRTTTGAFGCYKLPTRPRKGAFGSSETPKGCVRVGCEQQRVRLVGCVTAMGAFGVDKNHKGCV